MRQIIPTSKELGLITIEPGVTQQQLAEYLQQQGWDFMTPVTGAGPHCSVLANALERGYGITPRTDHFEAVTALKAVLPHPELCHTEYCSAVSSLDLSEEDFIDKTYKWGVGPYLDGMLTQSNLGIVTQISLRLGRKPPAFSAFYLRCTDKDKFFDLTATIRTILKDYEGIVGSINLMDRRRLISMVADNPNGTAHQVMSDQQLEDLAERHDVPQWLVVGSIYGDKTVVRSVKQALRKQFKGLGQLLFSDGLLLSAARYLTGLTNFGPLASIKKQLISLQQGIEIMLGVPNQVALPLAYWRTRKVQSDSQQPLLPDKDGCGLLWYAPLIPMKPEKMQEFVEFVRSTAPRYGVEPLITFTNLRHDCVDSTVPIVFNLADPASVQSAKDCLEELVNEGRKKGYVPYRLNTEQQQKLLNPSSPHWMLVRKLKSSLDPNNVLSPGRYNP
ncbi:FAD-binding oxidoreductase [Bowmanella dokdonensis]